MGTGGLFVSSDSGDTWSRVPGILTDGVFAAVTSGNEDGTIFAASTAEGLYAVHLADARASDTSRAADTPKLTGRDARNPTN
jgi:hypothetical protein